MMDTLSAMARGRASQGNRLRVFDWDKAARLIVEKTPTIAVAGLQDDLEYTGGTIWSNGDPVTTSYTYLASTWATPILVINGDEIECWRYIDETPGWDEDTKWPESALAIARGSA